MTKKAVRKETITEIVEGDHYLLEWTIEGTRVLTQYIVFLDGRFKGLKKEEGFSYNPGDESKMRAMIPQLIREVLRQPA